MWRTRRGDSIRAVSDDDDSGSEGFDFLTRRGIEPGLQHLVLTVGIVAILGIGFGAYWFGERIRIFRGGHSDAAHVVTKWDHDAPLARDLNSDGVEDVIGVYSGLDPGGIYIGAFDGKNGKILWRHGTLDLVRPARGGLLQFGLQGDRILINQKGKGTVIGIADGKPIATLELPLAREVCAGATPAGPLLVQTQHADQPLEVDLASNTVKPLTGRRPCPRATASAARIDPPSPARRGAGSFALRDGERSIALAIEPTRGATLQGYAGGATEPGWSTPVLSSAPATAMVTMDGNTFDAAGGKVFVGYFVKGMSAQHVLALDSASGKELWRVPIESPGSVITSLSATRARVYVAIGDFLVVLDAGTGKVVLDLGVGEEG